MKNTIIIKKAIAICAAGMLLSLSACKKDFNNINSSPNTPANVPNSALLTGAEKGLMDNTWDRWWNGSTGMLLAQYYAENLYTDESRYQFRVATIKDYWNEFYAGGIPDQFSQSSISYSVGGLEELQAIISKCHTDTTASSTSGYRPNQVAVALLLQTWLYQNMTDTWGDIPYSKALQDVNNTQPDYDKQSDIYPAMLAKIDTAISIMDVTRQDLVGDVIYNGNMAKWMKFANSLKVRVAMRMADRNPTVASAKVGEAVLAGVFTSNEDNALFPYNTIAPNYNPLYYDRAITGRKDFSSANTIVDVMSSLGDPRLPYYFDTVGAYFADTTTPPFVGRPYGQTASAASNYGLGDVSQPSGSRAIDLGVSGGALSLSSTAPGIFLDYAQIQFFLAEAAERGFPVAASAQDYYNAGINGSFQFWTGTTAPSSYMSQPDVDYMAQKGAGKTWQQIIGTQKWLALYMQGIQGWIEWRRLDFGILQAPVGGSLTSITTDVPTRMTYPYSEATLNPVGYGHAVSNQGADRLDTKVWWDMN